MHHVRTPHPGAPFGIRIAIAATALLIAAFLGQAYSLLRWDQAVELGLQNERFTGDAAERAWAIESWGVAAADMIWSLPLGIVAVVGMLRRRAFGLAAGLMHFAIGVYFPLVFAFQRWQTFRGTAILALCLFGLPSLIGIVGLWTSREMLLHGHCREKPPQGR